MRKDELVGKEVEDPPWRAETAGQDRGAGSLVLTLDHSTGAVSYAVCGSLELEEIEAVLNVFKTQSLEPALRAKWQKEAEERVRAREAEIAALLRDTHGIELGEVVGNVVDSRPGEFSSAISIRPVRNVPSPPETAEAGA